MVLLKWNIVVGDYSGEFTAADGGQDETIEISDI